MMDNISKIQGTSSVAVRQKLSAVKAGYYEDEFVECFCDTHQRFLPLFNRGIFARVSAIWDSVGRFIEETDGTVQIVSLGCGFDTLPFRLKQFYPKRTFSFLEIDYKTIVKEKINAMKGTKIEELFGKPEIKGSKAYITGEYKLVACDLTGGTLETVLKEHLDCSLNTFVLSELVLCYIEKFQSDLILSAISEVLPKRQVFIVDLINPFDAFGKQLVSKLRSEGVELFGIADTPTVESQTERLEKSGCTAFSADLKVYYSSYLDSKEKARIEKLEMMDEWEELNLLMDHMCISTGVSKGNESLLAKYKN